MNYYIKKWPQNTATVFNEKGEVIWTFTSVEVATQACLDYNRSLDNNEDVDIKIAA